MSTVHNLSHTAHKELLVFEDTGLTHAQFDLSVDLRKLRCTGQFELVCSQSDILHKPEVWLEQMQVLFELWTVQTGLYRPV